MTELVDNQKVTRSFWIISGLALGWNLIGVVSYLASVMISPEALETLTEAERTLHNSTPAWATGAYAIAVFAGTLASIALLLKKAWAIPVFILSLVGILVQMGHAFFMSDMLAIQGAGAAVLPVLIIIVAVYLVWYSSESRKKGWIA
ncbi:MAG: hypothetical protein AB8G77_14745 [Rhodothermales bacterium]